MPYLYGIRSERRFVEDFHLNLAYRWFCKLGLEGRVPDRSIFSKNRHGRFADGDVQDEDYSLLAELAQKANSGKEALSAARAARRELVDRLEGLLSGEIEDHDAALDQILHHITNAADEQADHADASGVLTAGLFDAASETADAEDSEGPDVDTDEAAPPAASGLPEVSSMPEMSDEEETDDRSNTDPFVGSVTETSAVVGAVHADDGKSVNSEVEETLGSDIDTDEDVTSEAAIDETHAHLDDDAPRKDALSVGDDDETAPVTDISIEAALAPQVDEPLNDTKPPVDPEILADLIDRDLLGVAADAAESFEAHGHAWPIGAAVLKAAAGSRAPHHEYGLDTQRFLSLANRATSDDSSDLGSVLLLGALIRPSILAKSATGLRSSLPRLCRGSLGQVHEALKALRGEDTGSFATLEEALTQHAPEHERIVINREVRSLGNSETTSEIWAHLASMLSPEVVKAGSRTAEDVSRDIRAWLMHKPQDRIVAMFDEADNFMDADTRDDYPELARLKKLMEDTGRAFKVVFAGLHNVQRMHRQPNSPLAHLGQPICIGPLNRTEDDKRAAQDLVVTPMRAAGFRFETHEAVEEILAWANYYPSLVQEYMKGLLSTLHGSGTGKTYKLDGDGPLWPIPSETLFSHRGFGQIESRIRYKFHLTLGLDPRYALVAYTLGRLNVEGQEDKARVTGFEPDELLDEARIFWPRSSEAPSLAAFEALLEELFDLGVLGRVPIPQTKRYRYLLGSRQVATMLGSEADIYYALSEIEDKDPAVAYDRAIHRRRYTTGVVSDQSEWHYCPLTDLQIERIVQPEDAPVQIVCGLEAFGLSKVGSSLKRIAQSGHLPGAPHDGISVEIVRSTRELRAQVDRKAGGGLTSIIVFTPDTPKEAHDSIVWLERQPRVLGKQIRPLILLDAAETEMRDVATRRREQSQFLAGWGAEIVRVHLHHIEKVELDTRPLREAMLSSTGGIPSETIKLIAAMRVSADPMSEARGWKATFRVPGGLLQGALGQALIMLDMAHNEDYQAFNELVREHIGADLTDLGPDFVATGLVSIWQPKSGRIRRSALGDLLSLQLES